MKILLLLATLVVGMVLFIRFIEIRSLYCPLKEIEETPSQYGMKFEEVLFRTQDQVELKAWYVFSNSGKESPFVFLLSHGNGGNIGHRLEKISILRELGVDIFIYDYRGYGHSQGSPSERGLYMDAMAAYKYLTQDRKIAQNRIILYGESLGGAVTWDLARKVESAGVISEDTFTSIAEMSKRYYPWIPRFLIRSRYDSLSLVGEIHTPKLIIHSVDDDIIPYEMGRSLYQACANPKRFLKLKGPHNSAFLDSQQIYVRGIRDFLQSILSNGSS